MANTTWTRDRLDRIANTVERTLYLVGAPGAVTAVRVLPTWLELRIQVAQGVRVQAVTKANPDLALALGIPSVRLVQAGGYFSLQVPIQTKRSVPLSALLRRADVTGTRAVLGLTENGRPLVVDLASPETPHILIAGTTGSGKTELLKTLATSMALTQHRHLLAFVVLDPKVRPDDPYSLIADYLLMPTLHTLEDQMMGLKQVVEAMVMRPIRNPNNMPRIVVIVDELADLCMSGGKEAVMLLTRIAQRGREAGVHLVAATQKPATKEIGTLLKANLPLRLVGRVTSRIDSNVASGVAELGAEALPGRGAFIAVGPGRPLRFQGALCDIDLPKRERKYPITVISGSPAGVHTAEALPSVPVALPPLPVLVDPWSGMVDKAAQLLQTDPKAKKADGSPSTSYICKEVLGYPYAGQSRMMKAAKLVAEALQRINSSSSKDGGV